MDHSGTISLSEFTAALLLHRTAVAARAKELQDAAAFRTKFLTASVVAAVVAGIAVSLYHRRK